MITINTKPDMTIEPGHQWLVIPDTLDGYVLAYTLAGGREPILRDADQNLIVAHTQIVDDTIMHLINNLAHVRFSAPNLVQLTMIAAGTPNNAPNTEDYDGGLEGA